MKLESLRHFGIRYYKKSYCCFRYINRYNKWPYASMNDGKVMDESWSNISYSRFINNENKIRDINIKNLIKRDANVDKEKKVGRYI